MTKITRLTAASIIVLEDAIIAASKTACDDLGVTVQVVGRNSILTGRSTSLQLQFMASASPDMLQAATIEAARTACAELGVAIQFISSTFTGTKVKLDLQVTVSSRQGG